MTTNYKQYIEDNTIRLDVSRRGGGIEIDASELLGIEGAKMTAYQNYLGGGMLGSIQSSRNFTDQVKDDATAIEAEDWDEHAAGTLAQIQQRPSSAY